MTGNVVFMDGFEVDFADNTVGLWNELVGSSGFVYYSSTAKRSGLGGLDFAKSNAGTAHYLGRQFNPAGNTHVVVGFGFYLSSAVTLAGASGATTATSVLALLNTAGTVQVLLALDPSTRKLKVHRGRNTAVLGTSTNVVNFDSWNYIELRVLVHPTAGEVELRLNGAVEFALTNQNTSPGASQNVGTVHIGFPAVSSAGGTGRYYFDDFIILDASGGIVWPQGAAIAMLGAEGDGDHAEWSSTGAAQYTEIDEANFFVGPPDDDTTYLSTSTVDARTCVQLTAPTILTGDVLGVQLCTYTKVADPALGKLTPFLRVDGGNYDLSPLTLTNSYLWYTSPATVNPATVLAWTGDDLDALQIGWKATT